MWQVRSVARPRRKREWLAAVALVPAIVLGLSACSSNSAPPPPQVITDKGTPFGDLLVPKLAATVTDGAVGVSVDSPVSVTAEDGVLGAVTMVNEDDGTAVEGKLTRDGLTWATSEPLGYNKRYTLTAESLGLGGATSRQMTFETHSPENLTMAYVVPSEGEVVGIGQPVAVQFDENIPNRLAAQQAIKIKTNPPVEGAFYWLNNREVRWRPAAYWKPGTTVEVAVNAYGVDLGDGLFGQEDVTTHFTIGDEVITRVDDNTKTLTVTRNGEVIKTMPVSMGKNSAPTNNGTFIVGDRFSHMVMDSSTYGVPIELAQRLPHRGGLGHPDLLQRDLCARRAVVGGQSGLQQCQPRLYQRELQQWAVVLRQLQARRHRGDHQHRGVDAVGHRGPGRLEHPVGAMESGQRQRLMPVTPPASDQPAGCYPKTIDLCAPDDPICSEPFDFFAFFAHDSYAFSGIADDAAKLAAGRLVERRPRWHRRKG